MATGTSKCPFSLSLASKDPPSLFLSSGPLAMGCPAQLIRTRIQSHGEPHGLVYGLGLARCFIRVALFFIFVMITVGILISSGMAAALVDEKVHSISTGVTEYVTPHAEHRGSGRGEAGLGGRQGRGIGEVQLSRPPRVWPCL